MLLGEYKMNYKQMSETGCFDPFQRFYYGLVEMGLKQPTLTFPLFPTGGAP